MTSPTASRLLNITEPLESCDFSVVGFTGAVVTGLTSGVGVFTSDAVIGFGGITAEPSADMHVVARTHRYQPMV